MLPTDSDMWCMLNAAIKEEHADGGHAYPLALVCGSSGVRCRGGLWKQLLAEAAEMGRRCAHVNMAHAQRHGHKGCHHAAVLPDTERLLDTDDTRQ